MRHLQLYITDTDTVTVCRKCRTHITDDRHIVSRAFQGTTGRAYLYSHVINIVNLPSPEQSHGDTDSEVEDLVDNTVQSQSQITRNHGTLRQMTTGNHRVLDAHCTTCNDILGWYYVEAEEEEQRYKEGKWCIERALVVDSRD